MLGQLMIRVFAVKFEAAKTQAWVDSGPEKVIHEAQIRLRQKGWSDVRPAVAVTVRYVEVCCPH